MLLVVALLMFSPAMGEPSEPAEIVISPAQEAVEVKIGDYQFKGSRVVIDQKNQRVRVEGTANSPAVVERTKEGGKGVTQARTITVDLTTGKIAAKER